MFANTAAWFTEKGRPFEVKEAPYISPEKNQIVIKNGAAAINPIDGSLQEKGQQQFPWITFPTVLGFDIAGEVVEVGSEVSRFHVGDRVLASPTDMLENKYASSGFQAYSTVHASMASHIPSTLSYEDACVIPLGTTTAATALFQHDYLALQHPSTTPKPTGKTLLIWGGATSVGSNAIQLAVAAGYEVISTASPKNFDYVKNLGASKVFDYHSETIIDELVAAFKGKDAVGALSCNPAAAGPCMELVSKIEGTKFVALSNMTQVPVPSGVDAKFLFCGNVKHNEVGKAIYENFLPKALAEGKYVAAPSAHVVGKGLESVQAAVEYHKKGISASKVVVSYGN